MSTYKVIETKFIPATNNKGTRIAAFDNNKNRVVIGYPHELSGVECHHHAAQTLCAKMQWPGRLYGGWSTRGCAFVLVEDGAL